MIKKRTRFIRKLCTPLPNFLYRRQSLIPFLVSVLIFAILFILIYKPLGIVSTRMLFEGGDFPLYTTVVVGTGFVTLALSRVIMNIYATRKRMVIWHYLLWIAVELLFFTFSLSLLASLIQTEDKSLWQLMMRIFVDVVGILVFPYVLTMLLMMIDAHKKEISKLTKRLESVPARDLMGDTVNFYDKGGKLSLVSKKRDILYIESADNYTNIHYMKDGREECFILHNSMKKIEETLSPIGLIRCHRSYMVNVENVLLMRKEKDGLVMELNYGGKIIPVSKSYNEQVIRFFAGEKLKTDQEQQDEDNLFVDP